MNPDENAFPLNRESLMHANFPIELFSGQRLPTQVFSNSAGFFFFFEFARAFGDGAWRLFTRLAREFDEPVVWCMSVEPDSKAYYRANFGETAQFVFLADGPEKDYTERMYNWPPTSIADAIGYRADVVAWCGISGRWACWGERETGLCILHLMGDDRLRKELILLSDDYVPILTLDEALSDIVSSEMTPEELVRFARGMHCNY